MQLKMSPANKIAGFALSVPLLGVLVSCCSGQTKLDAIETIVVLYARIAASTTFMGCFPVRMDCRTRHLSRLGSSTETARC